MDGFQFQYRKFCDFCGGNHPNYECQSGNFLYHSSFYEPPNLVSDFNRGYYSYVNNYDPGGWNNANYMWNQGNVQPSDEFDDRIYNSNWEEIMAKCLESAERQCQNFQRSFQSQDHEDSRLEEMWTKYIISNEQRMQNQEAIMQNQEAAIKKLEVQLSQLIYIVSQQFKDAEINSNDEVVEIELCSVKDECFNAQVVEEGELKIQKEHVEKYESLKENIEGTNMKADFDAGPRVGFDSFCPNIFLKLKFRNYEPCDLSDALPCDILKLKIKVDGRKYKYCRKRMKEI